MKKREILSLVLVTALVFSGCSPAGAGVSESPASEADAAGGEQSPSSAGTPVSTPVSTSDMFTDRDMEIGYDEETSVRIALSGDSASCGSDAVEISGSTVTVTEEGTYILSGTLNDGMIVVNAGDTDKIQLVLDQAEITNGTSAAIYVLEADKVFITTASGTTNTLSNGGEYAAVDDNNIDAVIFSKSDLTLNGKGTLTVSASAGHGIVSKDDLVFTGGTYDITAADHGISGKDSVRIAKGTYTISSGKDGIHAENKDDSSSGFLYIADGSFTIAAGGDGISAASYLLIENGTVSVTAGEGSASAVMASDGRGFGRQGEIQTQAAAAQEEDTVSQKGIKADGTVTIASGAFVMDTADDSIHAGGDILISDGEFELKSGDDAVHSDAAVTIQGGSFSIEYCYEGIEGLSVTVDDGSFGITSQDDGINSAGGADSSGFGGGRPRQDSFSEGSDSFIIINGGDFTITSAGDCIDSNGDLTINGGTLQLTCSGSGNTALDCDGSYAVNGGDVTTNDGSENNPGQMGGGMGGRGGMGPKRPNGEEE